ncbi:MAG: hypothetical protein ABSB15_18185 [Bryobacteraceae bacterium]
MFPPGRPPRIGIVGDLNTGRKSNARDLSTAGACIVGPLLLAYVLIATDMRTDLSELKPRQAASDQGAALVTWTDLATGERCKLPASPVRMLGYMMDWRRPMGDGTIVKTFILMPEAGHLLHPARRIPDALVEIRLADGHAIPYRDRSLIWVEGVLRRVRGDAREGVAAYVMAEASARLAEERDITRWFTP